MSPHHHCDAHTGLPRVWLGWGELGNRKAELEELTNAYFEKHEPDFTLLPSDQRRRGWEVHLDVIRKSTRWVDWRIDATGNKKDLLLSDLVRYEQIQSLVHFFYTGDYSVEAADLDDYPLPSSPDGCVTCSQICQLLRIHLAMFQTALLLRITDLQALAFRRFRELLDTGSVYVLQSAVRAVYTKRPIPDGQNSFQITGFQAVTDYRPELVLPAILRYCGYYRLNFPEVTMSRENDRELMPGEEEFLELRKLSADFDRHMARGLWLDTLDCKVPTLQISSKFPPIRSLHPYMQTPPASQQVIPRRSNYQYVSYLQPLPFDTSNHQGSSASRAGNRRRSPKQGTLSVAPTNQGSRARRPQAQVAAPEFAGRQAQGQILYGGRSRVVDPQPEAAAVCPANIDDADWTQTVNWNEVSSPGVSCDDLLNDNFLSQTGTAATVSANTDDADWTQTVNWNEVRLPEDSCDALLNDNFLSQSDAMAIALANTNDNDPTQTLNWNIAAPPVHFDNLLGDTSLSLPDPVSTGPANKNDNDWTQTMNWDATASPVNFGSFLNDSSLSLPDQNPGDAIDTMDWDQTDLSNVNFTELLGDTSTSQFFDPSSQALPEDVSLGQIEQNSGMMSLPPMDFGALGSDGFVLPVPFDMADLPPMEFSGLEQFSSPPQSMDMSSPPPQRTSSSEPQDAPTGRRYNLRTRKATMNYSE